MIVCYLILSIDRFTDTDSHKLGLILTHYHPYIHQQQRGSLSHGSSQQRQTSSRNPSPNLQLFTQLYHLFRLSHSRPSRPHVPHLAPRLPPLQTKKPPRPLQPIHRNAERRQQRTTPILDPRRPRLRQCNPEHHYPASAARPVVRAAIFAHRHEFCAEKGV